MKSVREKLLGPSERQLKQIMINKNGQKESIKKSLKCFKWFVYINNQSMSDQILESKKICNKHSYSKFFHFVFVSLNFVINY